MGVVGSLGGGGFFRISPCLPADQISNAEHLILCHPPKYPYGFSILCYLKNPYM